jgi:lysophospholipase L1-like esterase
VTYHNAGVPGDKVTGGYAGDAALRLTRDVEPWTPTVLTVMLGMNDGGYVPSDPKIFADYQTGYEKLLTLLRAGAPNSRITLIENTPYDEITHGTELAGFMATTERNAAATPALGRRDGLPVVDDHNPVKQLCSAQQRSTLRSRRSSSSAGFILPNRFTGSWRNR